MTTKKDYNYQFYESREKPFLYRSDFIFRIVETFFSFNHFKYSSNSHSPYTKKRFIFNSRTIYSDTIPLNQPFNGAGVRTTNLNKNIRIN